MLVLGAMCVGFVLDVPAHARADPDLVVPQGHGRGTEGTRPLQRMAARGSRVGVRRRRRGAGGDGST